MGVAEAGRLGIVDRVLTARGAATDDLVKLAAALASDPDYAARLVDKRRRRAADEAEKPLKAYRNEELSRMRLNFYGFDPSYHVARYNFIHKVPKSRTAAAGRNGFVRCGGLETGEISPQIDDLQSARRFGSNPEDRRHHKPGLGNLIGDRVCS